MRRKFAIFAAALSLFTAAPAAAVTLSGASPAGAGVRADIIPLRAGVTYRADFKANQQVEYGVMSVYTNYNYSWYDRETGNLVLSDHIDYYTHYEPFDGAAASFTFTALPHSRTYEPTLIIDRHYASNFELSFSSPADSAVEWSLDLIRLSSVPEPATWSLMIAGFGAIGATLRRRVIAA